MVVGELVCLHHLLFFLAQQCHTNARTVMMLYKQPARNAALKMTLLHLQMPVMVPWIELVMW